MVEPFPGCYEGGQEVPADRPGPPPSAHLKAWGRNGGANSRPIPAAAMGPTVPREPSNQASTNPGLSGRVRRTLCEALSRSRDSSSNRTDSRGAGTTHSTRRRSSRRERYRCQHRIGPTHSKEPKLTDEKVLDIPAFDMTEAAPNAVQSPSAGAKKAKTIRKRSGRPDGSVGRATFDAVNQMTDDGTRTKQAAFIEYGQRTNTKPGTVSANYYRVARAKGTSKPRKPRLATAKATTRPAAGPHESRDDADDPFQHRCRNGSAQPASHRRNTRRRAQATANRGNRAATAARRAQGRSVGNGEGDQHRRKRSIAMPRAAGRRWPRPSNLRWASTARHVTPCQGTPVRPQGTIPPPHLDTLSRYGVAGFGDDFEGQWWFGRAISTDGHFGGP